MYFPTVSHLMVLKPTQHVIHMFISHMMGPAHPGNASGGEWAFPLIVLSKNKPVPLHNNQVGVRVRVIDASRSSLLSASVGLTHTGTLRAQTDQPWLTFSINKTQEDKNNNTIESVSFWLFKTDSNSSDREGLTSVCVSTKIPQYQFYVDIKSFTVFWVVLAEISQLCYLCWIVTKFFRHEWWPEYESY